MTKSSSELNPRTTHFEFGGILGASLVTLSVPTFTYVLYYACTETSGACPPSPWSWPGTFGQAVTSFGWWSSLWDTQAFVAYIAWWLYCVAAWYVLPGDWVEGTTLRNGKKLKYKINAFSTLLLTFGLSLGVIIRFGPSPLTFIYDHWIGLVTSSVIFATVQAFAVYLASFRGERLLALGGNTGSFIYDFFIGRELNPAIGSFDIKSFNELRPGLILWVLIDISMACEQAIRRGGSVTDSMWLVLVFQIWYVADGLYNEPAILTTMDITTDGFGFMLSIGDLAWVPFCYSLQARYLAFTHVELGPIFATFVFLIHGIGYYIFRSANGEKDDFRNGRNPKNLQFFVTENGSKLLTSGWWGRSRHPNYFGDLLMALSYSMATGAGTPLTYFYPAYFMVLLIHRQIRDDENCKKKYGKDWEKYQKLVPYRIIPCLY